jgi:hypothetical protein
VEGSDAEALISESVPAQILTNQRNQWNRGFHGKARSSASDLNGVMENWSIGVLEYWRDGVLERWEKWGGEMER